MQITDADQSAELMMIIYTALFQIVAQNSEIT